jgi:mannan endo-1,4-beta-mannosidase
MRERKFTRVMFALAGGASALFLVYAFAHPVSPASAHTEPAAAAKAGTGHATPSAAHASATPSSAAASPSASAPAATATSVVSVSSLLDPTNKYLGVALDGVPNSMAGLTSFSRQIGKTPDMVAYYVPWGQPLNQTWVLNLANDGALPLVQFEPAAPTIAQIADGASDSYATSLAETVKALNVPVVFSFGHEMNGNWYAWGSQDTKPADFVKAWRRIHDVFAGVGATNVIWLWDANVTYPVPDVALEPLYPGDAYVNWIGLTGYYNITVGGRSTFDALFEPTMEQVREFTDKPFLIAETGVSPSSDKPNEIRDLFANVQDHSDVLGFVWFDYDKTGSNEANWMIDSDPTSEATFKSLAQGPDWGFPITP